ncbi:hypothetical protein M2132_001240 [Dysgonomonas sp. PH5-45]|uniref:hypothetical protein n=1 Tax=unclassified Dysgonomonas TaxID=2630389 RepID=UPI0024743E31|nr:MULTISPECIES: hypothetical protein [unclassified Dysgonomonas]MDH6354905.1 hypothetical protein [Dysgonomonas sp. PH5-45]MDH6387804.1 hypothetical protein [Dysgonomonas sp. PH5-37]
MKRTTRNRILYGALATVCLLIAVGFALNWYLTHRLESMLRKTLSEKILTATDGFYRFNFNKLDIGFFDGELKIEGISLEPDSLRLAQLAATDSLPSTYVRANVGMIHFKGLNLAWMTSRRKLHFDLFEIKNPDIQILDSSTSQAVTAKHDKANKTLFDVVAPFIDELTVKVINLEHANISYTALGAEVRATYALKDASFHAYKFRLDENSAKSGKLLYSENFDFQANTPQRLLDSEYFSLNTDNIQLSTRDSVILIQGIHLIPYDTDTTEHTKSIDAKVSSIAVRGIVFSRQNSLNYLDANSFVISDPDIFLAEKKTGVRDTQDDEMSDFTEFEADTTNQPWSVYKMIKPILRRVSVKEIRIDAAKLKYTVSTKNGMDTYTVNRFDFNAHDFLVDSLSDSRNHFWYTSHFMIDAQNINGEVQSNNHKINVGRFTFDMINRYFDIKNIEVSPLSRKSESDYLDGTIASINAKELTIEKGIEADELNIVSPNIEYFKLGSSSKTSVTAADTLKLPVGKAKKNNALGLIEVFVNHLAIKRISLMGANLAYNDRNARMRYRLNDLNLFATDFFMNHETLKRQDLIFDYEDFGLSFRNFNNVLPGGHYRLVIANANIQSKGGVVRLEGVDFVPQEGKWTSVPPVYLSLKAPLLEVKGVNFDLKKEVNRFDNLSLVNIQSPKLRIVKTAASGANKKTGTAWEGDILSQPLKLALLNLTDADIEYADKTSGQNMTSTFKTFKLKDISLASGSRLRVDDLLLDSPSLKITAGAQNNGTSGGSSTPFSGDIGINKANIRNLNFQQNSSDSRLAVSLPQLRIEKALWNTSLLELGTLNAEAPHIDYKVLGKTHAAGKESTEKFDIYKLLGTYADKISVGSINISNAELNYQHNKTNNAITKQKINKTNFGLEQLSANNKQRTMSLGDLYLDTENLAIPVGDGYYTLRFGKIAVSKKNESLSVSGIHLDPSYSKTEFAYKHPRHKDWFDVRVGGLRLSGIDVPRYFSENILDAKNLHVNDVYLKNFKNQQIEIEHNIMPMIYEGLQTLPLKFRIATTDVKNFNVEYEELPKSGNVAGKIFFTDMNATIPELTNIASQPHQFIDINADGKLMGEGYFTAKWQIPVDKSYDRFLLGAHLHNFDLRELNRLITPMAPAKVVSGTVKDVRFNIDASSLGGKVDMTMLYNGLNINILKDSEGKTPNKFISGLANRVIKRDNPDKPNKKPRSSHLEIERDPYHSTFNYMWQLLRPPLVESVGISQGKQNFVKKVQGVFISVRNFFYPSRKEKKDSKEKE